MRPWRRESALDLYNLVRAMHFSIGIGVVIAFLAALELFLLYDADHAAAPQGGTPEPN